MSGTRRASARRKGNTDFPRLVESGITAEFMSAWVDAPYAAARRCLVRARARSTSTTIHAFVDRHPDELLFATTAADVRRAKAEGKVAILIGVEGGHAIEDSLDHLRELYARGARYLTLTWNNGNAWAGSSIGVGRHAHRRPHRIRPRGRARDEPARHARRPLPRLGQHLLDAHRRVQGAR